MNTIQSVKSILRLSAAGLILAAAASGRAQVAQTLYSSVTNGARDNYSGPIGCKFEVGSSNVVVSHLGYYSVNTNTGLVTSHQVGILNTAATPLVLAQVVVPAGTAAYWTNDYYWVALNPPMLLQSNTSYIVAGLPESGDGDPWPDLYTPTWNTYFVGTNGSATRTGVYAPSPSGWPPTGFGSYGANETYGAPELGNLQVGQALVGVQQTNVAVSAGQTLSVTGFAAGQLPITYQWYSASGAAVTGQTNATLTISNSALGNSGTYYLAASNALGGEISSNVVVQVSAIPVGISQQPTNETVYANYPATFTVVASGTPPISYQWYRDGAAIPGATTNSYSFIASMTNNGDTYYCMLSNNINSVAQTVNSSTATLTVIANLAQPQELLHGFNSNLPNNNYAGQQGGQFTVGSNSVMVTHLGYYAWPANTVTNGSAVTCTLTYSHHVAIYTGDGSVLLGYVLVPAGSNPVLDGYMWQPLDPPLLLTNNTKYLLVAETFSGADPWGDVYPITDLNPYFASSCDAIYGGYGFGTAPYLGGQYAGQMYSAPNMAILSLPAPTAFVLPTNITQYAGFSATFTASVAGQPPLDVQWYEEPNILLPGQTNQTLVLSNLTVGESGSYYVIATNTVSGMGVQSPDSTLDVLPDVGPSITTDVQSQNVYAHQTVQFSVTATGTPTLTYQWTFDGNAIAGATNDVLTLTDVSSNNAGSYQVLVSNNYGSAASSVAVLTVTTPGFGSYGSAVLGTNLLLYYTFSDVNSGLGIATNDGSLGPAYNGMYEGAYGSAPGPLTNTDTNNLALALDGLTVDVVIPSLTNVILTNCTIAAWVNDVNNPQSGGNEAIFFQRQSDVFGLSVNPSTITGADQLRVTWNGTVHDSGLVLPTNQWALAAMTVDPTNIGVYLQTGAGLESTNFSGTFASQDFTGVSYIGWDTAGGANGRRWSGDLAEVMLSDQALMPVGVNALYLGVPASATLTISSSARNVVVTWPGGTLLQSTNVLGPWTPVSGATNGVYSTAASGTAMFYKVQLQ